MAGNGLKLAQDVFKRLVSSKGFDRVMDKVQIVSGGDGCCRAELVVAPEHQNRMGSLHGGLTATLVDTLSSVALTTHKSGAIGVTVDLHVSYVKAAAEGDTVVIDCSTLKTGRTLAFLSVEITKKETGELIARGSHTKFIVLYCKPHMDCLGIKPGLCSEKPLINCLSYSRGQHVILNDRRRF